MMLSCWEANADDRPTFPQLHSSLAKLGGFEQRSRSLSQTPNGRHSRVSLTPQPFHRGGGGTSPSRFSADISDAEYAYQGDVDFATTLDAAERRRTSSVDISSADYVYQGNVSVSSVLEESCNRSVPPIRECDEQDSAHPRELDAEPTESPNESLDYIQWNQGAVESVV